MQKQTTFIDSHAVEEGPEIVSSTLDLEELTYWEEKIVTREILTSLTHASTE